MKTMWSRVVFAFILAPMLGSRPAPAQRGTSVMDPERISGVWETSNGHGGAVGIQLQLQTTAPGHVTSLQDVPQSWQVLQIGVYERNGTEMQVGEANYFTDVSTGVVLSVEKDGTRLHIRHQSIDVDLIQKPDGGWSGRFHRGTFDAVVHLRRPGKSVSPLAGTWRQEQRGAFSCLHIAQIEEKKFVAWYDDLQALGEMRYANGLHRPETAPEQYGTLARIEWYEGNRIRVEFPAFSAICCSHSMVATLSDKDHLTASEPHLASWKKMSGDSCRVAK